MTILLLAVFAISAMAQSADTGTPGHTTLGAVRKVDHAAGKLIVKAADGTEEAFKFTGKTTMLGVHGLKDAGIGIERGGRDAPKLMARAFSGTGKGVRTLAAKTPACVDETLHLTKRCTIDTGKGVVKGTAYTANVGTHAIAHYTAAGGRKVGHLVKQIERAI
ncbi:MAG: hypothetical protein HYR56_20740 [Acidobacteria bacterium]|nr:hypothetical protein [Acidobacteriota bacterium]MBI3425913.1 hypothetical protein [Acidobacteriota bacterium]